MAIVIRLEVVYEVDAADVEAEEDSVESFANGSAREILESSKLGPHCVRLIDVKDEDGERLPFDRSKLGPLIFIAE